MSGSGNTPSCSHCDSRIIELEGPESMPGLQEATGTFLLLQKEVVRGGDMVMLPHLPGSKLGKKNRRPPNYARLSGADRQLIFSVVPGLGRKTHGKPCDLEQLFSDKRINLSRFGSEISRATFQSSHFPISQTHKHLAA